MSNFWSDCYLNGTTVSVDTKRNEIHAKTIKLYKRGAAFKKPGCEIKGGGHEMAAISTIIKI